MAIAPAGAMYKSLTFDNKTSREFGVYITGEAVYNAPEREVEMISIPGRNGSFALDKGRFENIPVKYPAGLFGDSETNFREALSDFRNFLCSKKGYCRLTDDYNPNEYRLGVYKSGLEVDNVRNIAGEFDILFDCMPQRWLTSGEVKQTIAASGDTITNPTLFDSKPLLEVDGYGAISFNGYKVEIENITYGMFAAANASAEYSSHAEISLSGIWATGDAITIPTMKVSARCDHGGMTLQTSSITDTASEANTVKNAGSDYHDLITTLNSVGFTAGTSDTLTNTATQTCTLKFASWTYNATYTLTVNVAYDGDKTITITVSGTATSAQIQNIQQPSVESISWDIYVNSSAHIVGLIMYIDCDLGAAYQISGNDVVSLDRYIDLGSELPTLAPGSNTITFDNTITSLKITPRWWKL